MTITTLDRDGKFDNISISERCPVYLCKQYTSEGRVRYRPPAQYFAKQATYGDDILVGKEWKKVVE